MNRLTAKNYWTLIVILAAVTVLFVLSPGCVYRRFLGIECPGCGLSRGCFALLHLRFVKAWNYNPISFAMPFWGLYIVWHGNIFKLKKRNRQILNALIVLTAVLSIFRIYAMFFGA